MKILVCSKCGQRVVGVDMETKDKVCLVCDNRTFKMVTLPDMIKCIYCKREYKTEDYFKRFGEPPFFDSNTATFYDGCRGWN